MILNILSFFLGTLGLYFFKQLPSLAFVSFIVALLSLIVIIIPKLFSNFSINLPFSFILIRYLKPHWVFLFGWGFLWAVFNAQIIIEQRLPLSLQKKTLAIEGVVDSIPDYKNDIQSFEMKVYQTFPKNLWANPGRIKLRWYDGPEDLKVGQVWRFSVKLKRPRTFSNPGSIDSERLAFLNKIVAEGRVIDSSLNEKEINKDNPEIHKIVKVLEFHKGYTIDRLRMLIKQKIESTLKDKPFAGIIVALVVGNTTGISQSQWEVFRNTGTAHLVAISGLHVSLCAGFFFWTLKVLWRALPVLRIQTPRTIIAAFVSVVAALIYALLAGFSLPTKRAVIMISLFILGIILKRKIKIWRCYFITLGIVVLCDPLSSLSAGFWLSFSAVGTILYGMRGRLNPNGIWWRWGRTQWVVFLGLTPITLALFNTASFSSPVANILAIPWVSFVVVPAGLLGACGSLLNDRLGGYGFTLAEVGMQWLWPLLTKLSNQLSPLSNNTVVNTIQTSWTIALSIVGVLLWLAPRGFPARSLGIVWILPLFLGQVKELEKNTAYFTLLDVGQGLATVIETQNHVLVFDTGPKLGQTDTGERVVLPFLATRGRQSIDILMVSHGDQDHAGGVHSIVKKMPVDKIISSEPHLFTSVSSKVATKIGLCIAGSQWEWDGVLFQVLHPEQLNTKKRNDHSCVLRVQAGQQSVLLTGDIETKSEKLILQRFGKKIPEKLQSNIIIVPHHGSRTSSSIDFIQAVNPQYALIPAGYLNAYGHPKSDIVERYQSLGITVLDTIQHGAISFTLGSNPKMEPPQLYRIEHQNFWH